MSESLDAGDAESSSSCCCCNVENLDAPAESSAPEAAPDNPDEADPEAAATASGQQTPDRRVLAFEEDAILFEAENRQYLLEMTVRDLKPLTNSELFRVLKTAILCQLEADFDFYSRRAGRPERAEQVREALAMYKKVFAVARWQTFNTMYQRLVLRGGRPDYYIRHIARRQRDPQQPTSLPLPPLSSGRRNLLDACFLEYTRRMEHATPALMQLRELSFSFEDCQLCLETGRVTISRGCCSARICVGCLESWVTTKVLSRSIEVGCPACDGFLNSAEIQLFLGDQSQRYLELVADANRNSRLRTCPQCNSLTQRPRGGAPAGRAGRLERRAGGQTVTCERCQFDWCFRCHGPTHPGITCTKNISGDSLMQAWAAQVYRDGYDTLKTARRCPTCGVWIEKTQGCNHIICSQCSSQFCFRCGCKWNGGNFLFGTHADQFSIFGCKKSLLPNRPVARKLARGSLFGLELLGLVVGLPAGFCLVVGLSPLIGIGTVGYFAYKHRQNLPSLY